MQHAVFYPYEVMDIARRQAGMSLDAVGLGPAETPSRILLSRPLFTVRTYKAEQEGPVLLLIPAPIKQAYLWDLIPSVSVVRRCLASGIRPYLIQWKNPAAHGQDKGLADYADTCISQAVEAVREEAGTAKTFAAGHSLGGTFAAIFASLHADLVQGLITLGAPMRFGPDSGIFAPMVSGGRSSRPASLPSGNIPGTFLDAVSYIAGPAVFGLERWIDWFQSLGDSEAMRIHACVERWSLDEMPIAEKLFADIVGQLYRDDLFMQGGLVINGKHAAPEQITAPVLAVADSGCPVVPARSILPFYEAVRGPGKQLLWYEGETGVALRHVGYLVGRAAHRRLWPKIMEWIHEHRGEP